MRRLIFGIGLSVAAAGIGQPADAAVLFDTLTGLTSAGRARMIAPGNPNLYPSTSATVAYGGPLAQSFYAPYDTDISTVKVGLRVTTPGDGGSVMVYLVNNTGGGVNDPGAPVTSGSGSGLTFNTTSATLLGSVDYSGFTAGVDTPATVAMLGQVHITAGQYWLGLMNTPGTSAGPGGTNGPTGTARWSFLANFSAGITGVLDQEVYGQFSGSPTGSPSSWGLGDNNPGNGGPTGLFQAQIVDTPEPATLALVGAGLAALGLARRRRRSS